MIGGTNEIRDAYRDVDTAQSYIAARFIEPLGALLHERQVAAIRRHIREQRPHSILEIAPGPARLTVDVAASFDGVGIIADASAAMLAQARARLLTIPTTRAKWHLLQADAFELPLAAQFDLVYTMRLIRHFELLDRLRVYRQAARILRPGGYLIFDAVNEVVSAPLRHAAPEGEYRHFDALLRPEQLKAELREAGFALESLQGVLHRYRLLRALQTYLAPRSRPIARSAMGALERFPGREPLEWIVTCRRE